MFWLTTCPNCHHQGRLIVMNDLTRNRLYLHCEECESGWVDPEQVSDPTARFLTLDEEFDAEPATEADLRRYGWPIESLRVMADE
jgi:hypothetical protein